MSVSIEVDCSDTFFKLSRCLDEFFSTSVVRNMTKITLFILSLCMLECTDRHAEIAKSALVLYPSTVSRMSVNFPFTDGWDYPVGPPNAVGYYDAQPFGRNMHLGEDWNGVGGGNSDLGDAIHAAANGEVSFAKDISGGWGKVIILKHHDKKGNKHESLYGHCDTMLVNQGDLVKRGEQIATIGTADGAYLAHLHFELREGWSKMV